MGKGREIAGLLVENWLQGRKKSLWVSMSSDLKVDAARDLSDCGVGTDELEVVVSLHAHVQSIWHGTKTSAMALRAGFEQMPIWETEAAGSYSAVHHVFLSRV